MGTNHCRDIYADRKIGELWERQFCRLAAGFGKSFTPMQIGREQSAQSYIRDGRKWKSYILPDVTVWTYPGEHHEIKHKNPTQNQMFGLEVYRFNALLWFAAETSQDVLYTIHDWSLTSRENTALDIAHWKTVTILDLDQRWIYTNDHHPSWINGKRVDGVLQHFWPIDLWSPLFDYWTPKTTQHPDGPLYPDELPPDIYTLEQLELFEEA